jgi:lipopolysaccharide/colanic/teichoic acid biosynthesis glycosyltransferase
LTGLWQVSDRADGGLELQEALDTYYIRHRSL